MAKLRNLFPLLCALYAASAGAQGALDLYTISQTDLRGSARFMSMAGAFGAQLSLVQLSHPNMTTGKTIALTRWTFVGKVMSLLFNMLSRLVIAVLHLFAMK